MKKIISLMMIVIFIFIFSVLLMSSEWECSESSSDCKLSDFKTSKHVTIKVNSDNDSFAAISHHSLGDYEYGTASDTPKIYKKKHTGDTTESPTADNSSAFSGNEWKEQ